MGEDGCFNVETPILLFAAIFEHNFFKSAIILTK